MNMPRFTKIFIPVHTDIFYVIRMSSQTQISQTPNLNLIYETSSPIQNKTTVLWVSRHSPLPAQIKALEEKLGVVKIYQFGGTVPNAEFVADLAKQLGAKIVVPVLPLSIIARLSELSRVSGFTLLWAEMEQVKVLSYEPKAGADYNPENETVVVAAGAHEQRSFKIMRFKQFHRIISVTMVTEPW